MQHFSEREKVSASMPRILLAEDDDVVRDMLQECWNEMGSRSAAARFEEAGRKPRGRAYPRTLIFEKDKTARPEVGRPIDIAGRNVVKISIRFTCGRSCSESFESERMR